MNEQYIPDMVWTDSKDRKDWSLCADFDDWTTRVA